METRAVTAHYQIDAETIARVAARVGVHETTVKKVMLCLVPDDHQIVATLIAAGVDETFLNELRGVFRRAPAIGRVA